MGNVNITGNDLKRIREKLGETQSQFAKRLKLKHYQRVIELEKKGNKSIGAKNALKILRLKLDQYIQPL